MGSVCVSEKKQIQKAVDIKKAPNILTIINEKQLRLLKLLYADLASRSAGGEMTMQNFLLFFHKNGYWGERLFKQFDTGNTKTITEDQFIRGIVKIFKTSEEKKIELLFKFFSQNNMKQGISFTNFLKMLYNYPKEQIYKIINDSDFINNQLKKNLVSLDQDAMGRRLQSILPKDLHNSNSHDNKRTFILNENQNNSDKVQSKYGAKIINEMNKKTNQRTTTLNFRVGDNNVQVKTTSVHQLVKRFAKSIFKKYQVNSQKSERLRFQSFRDWIMNHKILYIEYYKGFHNQVWEVEKATGYPLFVNLLPQFESKARILIENQSHKVIIMLLQSILIVCQENDRTNPITYICLEGLSASPTFDNNNGYGIQLSHRDGVYQKKIFYLINQQMQKSWMDLLKYYKGQSPNQIYQFKQKIGIGKFSIVYNCIEKATGQSYAIKVIESFKLDEEARKIIAHESSIMSVMSHPLLVFFKQTITTKTHIYIVTELVKGKDLFGLVKDFKFLGEAQACYILEQIIIGVRYIHSLGIVHRDLKPENIMMEYDDLTDTVGNIKIIDFGFANYITNLVKMPIQELLVGTPNYIAPQLLKRQPFNQKIDNFAIGSIFYFMLSGYLPFNSNEVAKILQKTVEGSFPLQDRHWRTISSQAKDLVEKLLANDPHERISLEEALNHEWFLKYRSKRQNNTSLKMPKNSQNNGDKQKGAVQ